MARRKLTRQEVLEYCLDHPDVPRLALKLIETKVSRFDLMVKEAKRQQEQSKQWRQMFLLDAKGIRADAFEAGDLPAEIEAIRTDPRHSDKEFIAALFGVDVESLERQFRKRPKKRTR